MKQLDRRTGMEQSGDCWEIVRVMPKKETQAASELSGESANNVCSVVAIAQVLSKSNSE
jgi:hypothetical protein